MPVIDKVLADATTVALARRVVAEVAEPGAVGEHVAFEMLEDRLGTHYFACASPAYPGWRWSVVVARPPRAHSATVSETNLVPADGALLAPPWLPYADRIAPGDLGPGDVLPYVPDDPFLEAGFEATGEEDVDETAFWELGLGRTRVLSAEGREAAATRWHTGKHGTRDAAKAQQPCSTCGYFLPMAGALRQAFGVCANEWSPDDGCVVSLDHGCGAHSETDVTAAEPEEIPPPILDDYVLDLQVPSEA